MKPKLITVMLVMLSLNACSQTAAAEGNRSADKKVGGSCEDCEAVFEYGNKALMWIDTLPDFHERGPKLEITGTIFKRDGKTPAKDVILYIYHTDQKGEYALKGNETGLARKHGYVRGWIRTNADGRYKFYTLKPAAYPGGGNPAHIHPVIKEPGVRPYWIDEYLFEGDPYLTAADRKRLPQRGGPGILSATKADDGMLRVKRDIILGLNVEGYE